MKGVCQYSYQLPEVHPIVGYIIKNGFVAVALVFYIANFHVEPEFFGNLTGTQHGVVLAGFGFLVFIKIHGTGFTVNPSNLLLVEAVIDFFHLLEHQVSGKAHFSYIVPRGGFHSYQIALLQRKFIIVQVIAFACIFELHLDVVCRSLGFGQIAEPVESVEFFYFSTTASLGMHQEAVVL